MRLDCRTVVLTGASGGIGSVLCAELVRAGARVLAVGRSAARLAVLAGTQPTGMVTWLAADLDSAPGRAALVQRVRSLPAPPAMLILGHAHAGFGLFEEQSGAELAQALQANLVSPALLIHDLLPLLDRRGGAAVVAIGSTFGSIGFAGFSAYSASKFGLRGLFESLAREYADAPVRFQYLSPRATRTAFNAPQVDALNAELKTAYDTPEAVARQLMDAIVRGVPRRQLGWPEKLFVRINGAFPALVDRSLLAQLPIIRRHARRSSVSSSCEAVHEPVAP